MRKTIGSALVTAAALVGLVCGNATAADDAALFVGTKSCAMCHRKAESGDQFGKWQASPHAKAYAVLATEEAKAAGAKVGVADPQKSGKCLKCHATAYNFTEELQVKAEEGGTAKIVVEDGVSCESCHGAGKNYKAKSVMLDRAQATAAGMVYPATKNCERCHNEKSPSWKADRYTTKDGKKAGFDVEQAMEKIKHPDPNVKK